MNAQYHEDGTVTLTMTRAEAHVFAWGGTKDIEDGVGWNARQTIIKGEDALEEETYSAILDEAEALSKRTRYSGA